MTHVSVIIPTFNDGDFLIKCVNSARSSKHILSFHISDNNSYNHGFSYAINRGIEDGIENNADHFLLLNADTELAVGCLDALVDVLDSTGAYLVTGTTETPRNELSEAVDGACVLISRKTVEDVGMLDQSYYPLGHEFEDYFMRIKNKEKKMYCVNWATFTHYVAHTKKTVEDYESKYRPYFANNTAYFVSKWHAHPNETPWITEKFVIEREKI